MVLRGKELTGAVSWLPTTTTVFKSWTLQNLNSQLTYGGEHERLELREHLRIECFKISSSLPERCIRELN